EGVVGFKLHHRPDNDAGCGENVFEDRKLRKEVGFDSLTCLVILPEVVAKRLDDVVGGNADVRDAVAHHGQQRGKHAADCTHFAAPLVTSLGHGKVVAKQLVRSINQIDFQPEAPSSP